MSNLNEDAVLEALRKVKYPGFSRDIVSFGFVKDVAVGGGERQVHAPGTNRRSVAPSRLTQHDR